MKALLLLLLFLLPGFLRAQKSANKTKKFAGCSFIVPEWLTLKEAGNDTQFGGTLPAVEGVENAILLTAIPKSSFASFKDFQTYYLDGNRFGQPAQFNREFIWYGQKEPQRTAIGVEQKVFLLWRNKVYHNKFVLTQTPSSFLWIQFVSTPETYEKNLGKFDEFLRAIRGIRIESN